MPISSELFGVKTITVSVELIRNLGAERALVLTAIDSGVRNLLGALDSATGLGPRVISDEITAMLNEGLLELEQDGTLRVAR